jgi:hypothetical protein
MDPEKATPLRHHEIYGARLKGFEGYITYKNKRIIIQNIFKNLFPYLLCKIKAVMLR